MVCLCCKNQKICKIYERIKTYEDTTSITVTACTHYAEKDAAIPKTTPVSNVVNIEDRIEHIRKLEPKPKKKDMIKKATADNVCAGCGTTNTDLLQCNFCGEWFCPDCVYESFKDDSVLCIDCYAKKAPDVL